MSIDPARLLADLYEASEDNHFDDPAMGPLFDPPMVAVAVADDPWFAKYKEVLGEWHWTPAEALKFADPAAEAKSVISWCLPIGETARVANGQATVVPAREWAYVRTFGEEMNSRLRRCMVQALLDKGFAAAAPQILPENKTAKRPKVGRAACWSERHVAFVAGLGTFGISGGLITRRGVAHRLGSVVTNAEIPPTPRPYGDDPFAWCLRTARGTCGVCVKRCPAGSVGETIAERDKEACHQYTYGRMGEGKGKEIFGWEGAYGCGLCQTAVPCEHRNPTAH